MNSPLAIKMAPEKLSDLVGQKHLIGKDKVLSDIETGKCGSIPEHIRITANGYKYPHNYPNDWVDQQYLPENLKNKKYYIPKETCQYEKTLKTVYDNLEKLKANK